MQYIARNRSSFIDQLNPYVNRIFQHAVMQGDLAVVTLMLKHGIVVRRNQRNPHGLTALQQSVLDGNNRLVVLLLEYGADLEARTSNGWTCLHIASATGDFYIAKLLLANCADIVALTSNEELPIDLATNTDMKILLANEMSRCGYIELSQWYMGKLAQEESGVLYLMSADSLIDIACDRPDPFSNQGYEFYHQNYMQTYSSMINLSRCSAPDAKIGKVRKTSAWSLAQPSPYLNLGQLHITEDSYSSTLPAKSRRDRSSSKDERATEAGREPLKKSSSTASVIERVDYSKVLSPSNELVTCSVCDNDLLTFKPNDVSSSSQYLNTACQEGGTKGNVLRRNSMRRKKSSPQNAERIQSRDEVDHRLELTIDYFKESLDYDDDFEEDCDYLEFKGSPSHYDTTSSSEISLPDKVTEIAQDSISQSEPTSLSLSQSDAVAENSLLLQEFADPNRSGSHFEIDTDKMDQYIVNKDGSVDQIFAEENNENKSFESGIAVECNNHGNMYFNPMYKSTDMQAPDGASIHPVDAESDALLMTNSEGEQDIHFNWESNESGSTESECVDPCDESPTENPSSMSCNPYEIYSEETEVICNKTELYERKRKKRGILSELVSRFKKGSSKMERTSSDTNVHENEDASIVRRDTRKVKTLRRRRHVRRSNSFSSYFTQNADKTPKADSKGAHDNGSAKDCVDKERNKPEQRSITAPPYSPHRREKRFSAEQDLKKAPATSQKFSSLPRKGSKGSHPLKNVKKFGNALCAEEEWMQINNYNSWGAVREENPSVTDSKMSKIPTRSLNTFVHKDLATYQ